MLRALAAGFAGASTLTALHQALRLVDDRAPRADILGMRALAQTIEAAGGTPPDGARLYGLTLAGDLVSNALYYSLTGTGRDAWWRGALLGLSAGIGAVVLPPRLGLGSAPTNRTTATQLETVALYLAGGLVTAAVARALARRSDEAEAHDGGL